MKTCEVLRLSKSYVMGEVEVQALREVSFDVSAGQYLAITGPSGSGKSTLLNLLGCLDRPTSGAYRLDGRDVSHLDDDALSDIRRGKIGFVFQSFNLIPRLTVVENIEMPLFYAGLPHSTRRERALRIAEMVGLGARTRHRPSELSGGEMQRVAIARALVSEPVMVLADEPTGNLDSKTGGEIMGLIDQIWKGGATIITVTHDERVAAAAQRIIHLVDGELVRDTNSNGEA